MEKSKSRSSEGTKMRLIRMLEGKHALSVKEICKEMDLKERQARWYVAKLLEEDLIFVRYTHGKRKFYAIRREG